MSIELFSDRIIHLTEMHGGASNLARLSGVSESVVRKWKDGKSEPTRDKLEALSKAAGVNIQWLVLGTGPKQGVQIGAAYSAGPIVGSTLDSTIDSAIDSTHQQQEMSEFALIPGYSIQVSAGHGVSPESEQPTRRLAFRHRWLKYRGLNEKDLVMVFTKGDSMEPTIADNNTLMVDTSNTDPQDGGIYVIRNDGHLLVKRTQIAPGQGVWLISDNKEYDKLLVNFGQTDDLEVIGKVVWIGKDM